MTGTARLYGDSLYDLAVEEQLTDVLMEQTIQIRDLFRENPDYLKVLSEPSIPRDERIGLIDKAFGNEAEHYLVNFIKLLCERGLLGEYAGCCEEFTRRFRADRGIAEAKVVTAVDLDDAQKAALKTKLEKLSGKTISLSVKVDPAVIGGIRVELDGKQLDGTVHGRLEGISRKLNEVVL